MNNSMKSELCIHHHLGLGDHFDMNGMVRNYLKEYDKIHIFSKSNYFKMIDYMYRDEENILVVEIPGGPQEVMQAEEYYKNSTCDKFLRIGFENYPFGQEELYDKNCWEFFYEQVNVPYYVRTSMFHVERDEVGENQLMDKLNPKKEKFIFVHDDKSRGFEVNRSHFLDRDLLVLENDVSENIFHFIKLIEEAEEIHCMESSMKSLIDLYAKTDKIFYHDFRNQPIGKLTNKKWNVIKYG
tara:strand:- start:2530 stop:3249 length:720 start_codon:yes stop_codon:yes gene_type:complete